ncbi:MAG: response regulator [Pseudomonadota bacterium]
MEKILVVDDEKDICEVLDISLSDIGYKVYTAGNGEEALQVFEKYHPPIILTDIRMPGIDGIELLQRIKERDRDTEVIMITGHGDLELAIKSLKLEATDFITKPINYDILEIALKRAHERISMRLREKEYTENLERLVREKSEKLVEAERQLAEKYQQLFDEVPCYISVQDRDLRLVETNRRFKDDFEDKIGSFCYSVYKHRDTPCPDCPVQKTFEEEKSQQHETVVTSRTGEQTNVLVWTAPIRDAEGEVTHVMEMSTNITQIRKLQDRLTSLGLLLSSISHGIKGILTGLDGGMYWIDTGIGKNDPVRLKKGRDALQLIISRISNLVLNLLYYAKKRELNLERTDVIHFARDTEQIFQMKLGNRPIEFLCDFEPVDEALEVDTGIFSSALLSILENAADACMEDKSKGTHRITFRVKQEGDHILFNIEDNGIGMDRETKESMFTLFFSSKAARGTGLGLFVANEIVQQHGGSIEVESNAGEGSAFLIKIPRVHAIKAGKDR